MRLFSPRAIRDLGLALNRLLSHVRTPYFLLLPDDWLLDNPKKAPFIRKALAILECDGRIGNVNLDGQYFLEFNDRLLYAGPFRTPVGDPEYFVRNPALPWAGFHLSPMIGRTAAFHDVGPFREDQPLQRRWAELDYARRFGERWVAAKSPALSLFQHVGHEPCPGWLIHSGPGQNDLSNSEPGLLKRDSRGRDPHLRPIRLRRARLRIFPEDHSQRSRPLSLMTPVRSGTRPGGCRYSRKWEISDYSCIISPRAGE